MRTESVAFTYDGTATATLTIRNAQIGHTYRLTCNDPDSSSVDDIATTSTLVLTVDTIGGLSEGDTFYAEGGDLDDGGAVGATVFSVGSPSEFAFVGTWDYDGDDTVGFTFDAENGVDYDVSIFDSAGGGTHGETGAGAPLDLAVTAAFTPVDSYFWALVEETTTGRVLAVRLFEPGVAGAGLPGNPTSAIPPGVSIALDDGPLEEEPVWTRLDVPSEDPWRTVAWEVTGPNRSKETDKPGTSSATVTLIDRDGTWDLTNPFSALAQKLVPGRQVAITLPDSNGDWHWRYRGILDDIDADFDVTAERATVKLEVIDLAAYLAQITMRPGTVGDDVPAGTEGFIYFNETAEDDPLEAASRMHDVCDAYSIPVARRNFFTGNVRLQATAYGRDESALDPIIDASDAEFPGVGVFFTTKAGILAFRGRKARFLPESYMAASDLERDGDEQVCFWSVASKNVLEDDPGIVICTHLGYRLSRKDVINDAMILPANVDSADLGVYDSNHIEDTDSKAAYGTMTLDAVENIQTLAGEGGTTALEETEKMSRFWVDNFREPAVRITSISFVSRSPGMEGWAALQDFLAGVDISDVVTVTTRHFSRQIGDGKPWPSSFGFAADYFVEGIQMAATPDAQGGRARVTATLDVSPRAFYDTDPWGT